MITFTTIRNQIPIRLFLKVWPPFNEESQFDIDLSIGMNFENNLDSVIIISTDKNDLTSPIIYQEKLPDKIFDFSEFKLRMNEWLEGKEIGDFDYEYYEITNDPIFKNIVLNKILDVQYIKLKDNENPVIGIKILFTKDYIISVPISDGNTIETFLFNKHDSLKHFRSLGKIEYENIPNSADL